MKIGTITSTVATTSIDTDRRTVSRDSSSTTTLLDPDSDGDSSTQVELSPEATMLATAGADPAFDSEKVERIAQAIRDG